MIQTASSKRAYGVYTGEATRLPISNRTVKLARADGTQLFLTYQNKMFPENTI
jgi:hypothetical protein